MGISIPETKGIILSRIWLHYMVAANKLKSKTDRHWSIVIHKIVCLSPDNATLLGYDWYKFADCLPEPPDVFVEGVGIFHCCLLPDCSPTVPWLFPGYFLTVYYLYPGCSVCVPWLFLNCSLAIPLCSLAVPWCTDLWRWTMWRCGQCEIPAMVDLPNFLREFSWFSLPSRPPGPPP